jgi:hypothetical protein
MKISKRLLALLMGVSMLLCLAACGEAEDTSSAESATESSVAAVESSVAESSEESVPQQTAKFAVTVVDQNGDPVSGAMVQICKDSCMPAMTGEDGVASFNIEITDGYKLSVMTCPEGYTYEGEAEIYLEYGATEYTLTLTKGN